MPHGRGGSWIWPATRWAIYFRDRFRCVHCGIKVIAGAAPWHRRRRRDHGDEVTACIDHPYPDAPVDRCVTSCWQCNSSAQERARTVEVRPLTPYHRAQGRRLFKLYRATRDRALAQTRVEFLAVMLLRAGAL